MKDTWRSRAGSSTEHTGEAWPSPVRQDKGFRNPLRFVSTPCWRTNDLAVPERKSSGWRADDTASRV
jgi:hypothetical protein